MLQSLFLPHPLLLNFIKNIPTLIPTYFNTLAENQLLPINQPVMDRLQRWKAQYRFYRIFLLSTLKFSVLIAFLFAFMGSLVSFGGVVGSIKLWLQLIPTVGLGFDYIYKELTRKEEYFFYYNQGISKYKLWAVTFIVMFVSSHLLNLIIQLCVQGLK